MILLIIQLPFQEGFLSKIASPITLSPIALFFHSTAQYLKVVSSPYKTASSIREGSCLPYSLHK
jgi:hypothetical protein